jgi:hypothetical protein
MCMKLRPIAYGISTAIIIGVFAIACSVLTDPQLPPDIAKVESCIQQAAESGVTDPIAIAITCAPGEEQFVADFLSALLGSSWATAHPILVGPLQSALAKAGFRSLDGGVR